MTLAAASRERQKLIPMRGNGSGHENGGASRNMCVTCSPARQSPCAAK
jgi:hypothetical protein